MSPVPGRVERQDDRRPASESPQLQGRAVLFARRAGRPLLEVHAALALAGAIVLDVANLSEARRSAALLGPRAAVVFDLPAVGEPARVPSALRVQDAVLLLSATVTPRQRVDLLRAGADHVLSGERPEEVLACLAAVLRRTPDGPPADVTQVLRVGPLSVHLPTRTATVSGRLLGLTALEFDLLAYFLAHAGQPLRRERLLADVWGYDYGGLDTVTVHVRRLRVKIEQDPARPLYLTTVWGRGYRLETEVLPAVPAPRPAPGPVPAPRSAPAEPGAASQPPRAPRPG